MAELASEVARPDVGDGPEDLAHYARNDELAQARREGRAKALCGTLFHPHADHSRCRCVVCRDLAGA